MIYYKTVWDTDKNIGKAYNREMELLPNDSDYACFLDGDAMFLTPYFGKVIESVVDEYPECGVFTCMTNRVACDWQIPDKVDWESDDIKYHRHIAQVHELVYGNDVEDVTYKPKTNVLSGVLILIRKDVWRKIGGFIDGMLGVDNALHWACQKHGEPVYLMLGVYVYHFYRGGNRNDTEHLK